eukprot:5639409-Pleurochrysis_carterae.AAC.1
MPTPQLKSQSWLRSLLMMSRWRRRTHHPHRRMLGGRKLRLIVRNRGRNYRLDWVPGRLALRVTIGLMLSSQLAFR